jgi:hypothetical protein
MLVSYGSGGYIRLRPPGNLCQEVESEETVTQSVDDSSLHVNVLVLVSVHLPGI